mmetsp:Transcript_25971/g.68115  ORF Transcript_25971/g.68115 Transcript_25971/m.68115 type:complete len:155 (+) Transcript_25971:409-873(+)
MLEHQGAGQKALKTLSESRLRSRFATSGKAKQSTSWHQGEAESPLQAQETTGRSETTFCIRVGHREASCSDGQDVVFPTWLPDLPFMASCSEGHPDRPSPRPLPSCSEGQPDTGDRVLSARGVIAPMPSSEGQWCGRGATEAGLRPSCSDGQAK